MQRTQTVAPFRPLSHPLSAVLLPFCAPAWFTRSLWHAFSMGGFRDSPVHGAYGARSECFFSLYFSYPFLYVFVQYVYYSDVLFVGHLYFCAVQMCELYTLVLYVSGICWRFIWFWYFCWSFPPFPCISLFHPNCVVYAAGVRCGRCFSGLSRALVEKSFAC